jgi:amino acid adenylation domain-containing protein
MFFTELIFEKVNGNAENTAAVINNTAYSYAALAKRVGAIQALILNSTSANIGILAINHIDSYAAIVACWLSGKAYVPLQSTYPKERIESIVDDAGIELVLTAAEEFPESLSAFNPIYTGTLPENKPQQCTIREDSSAYILFTSGTTGKPKGVPISYGNLQAFLHAFHQLGYTLGAQDRFLQMFELTFDLSVMSFMVPLSMGASFYTLPDGMIKTLGLYHVLEEYQITFALMVPSAIQLLKPYFNDIELPYLRVSQFCGEALKADILSAWFQCIPNARVDNVYGPTEATIYCTGKTLNINNLKTESLNGIAGIGQALKGTETALFADGKEINGLHEPGELCLAGSQLTSGYLKNETQNEKSFFISNGKRYYRTGDLVKKDENGNLFYIGRADDQVKIQGYRIELAEIELACNKILPENLNTAVGFLDKKENWLLALFIHELKEDEARVRQLIEPLLPNYMVPHLILGIDNFPLNANGKTDKNKLRTIALANL